MRPAEPTPARSQFSLGDMCRLVGFVGVFFACLLPLKEANGTNFGFAMLGEAMFTPLVLALAAQFLVRRGAFRLWLTWFLLAVSGLAVFGALMVASLLALISIPTQSAMGGGLLFALLLVTNVALGWELLSVVIRLIPEPCPRCGRTRLFRDMRRREDLGLGVTMLARCVACGARFGRKRLSVWRELEPGSGQVQDTGAQPRQPLSPPTSSPAPASQEGD